MTATKIICGIELLDLTPYLPEIKKPSHLIDEETNTLTYEEKGMVDQMLVGAIELQVKSFEAKGKTCKINNIKANVKLDITYLKTYMGEIYEDTDTFYVSETVFTYIKEKVNKPIYLNQKVSI